MRGNLAPQKERWAFSGIYYGSLHTNVQNIQCYNFQEGDRAGREGKTTTMNSPQHQAVTFQMSASRWKEPQVRMRNTEELNTKLWREGKKIPIHIWAARRKHSNFVTALEAGSIYHMLSPPLHKEINPVECRLHCQCSLDGGDSWHSYDYVPGRAKSGENLNKV